MPGGRRALRFRVTGRVQGVGFRYSAIHAANRLFLSGWVRNEDDGSVSGFAQGDPSALEAFTAWLGRGPAGATVERVETSEAAPEPGCRGFDVEY